MYIYVYICMYVYIYICRKICGIFFLYTIKTVILNEKFKP